MVMTDYYPARVTEVAPKSVAARCHIEAGDHVLAIDGTPLRDVIDVQIYGSDPEFSLLFQRGEHRRICEVRRRYGEPLGLVFAEAIFDGEPRTCRNRCDFCFVAQMAPDLRSSLYVKDDDYRLSFLHGNYMTLTNLTPEDWARIDAQYLSPLYVSVHATEPEVRVGLMHNPRAGQVMDQLARLAELSITVHTQAVLVPGRNDGPHLDRTIEDLASLYPAVQDLSVVPVGLTRWHDPHLRTYTDGEAGEVLAQVLGWQARLRDELGVAFVYPSDEWFLRAGMPVPAADAYDGPVEAMIENGVGMVRRFLDGWPALHETLADLGGGSQTWITGALFAPVLRASAENFAEETGIEVDVVPVTNHFFGESVTVAGLLTIEDVVAALAPRVLGDVVVAPGEMFRGPQGQSLDGATPTDLARILARTVCLIDLDGPRWGATCVEP
jgi:putative radical SAM enzyme (TIGR03279 family)